MADNTKTNVSSAALDFADVERSIASQDVGTVVDILGLDGKTPLGLGITIAGPDSERAIKAREDLSEELVGLDPSKRFTPKELNDRECRYLSKVTIKWSRNIIVGGEEIAFSERNALKLYQKFAFIREQLSRASGDRTRFTQG